MRLAFIAVFSWILVSHRMLRNSGLYGHGKPPLKWAKLKMRSRGLSYIWILKLCEWLLKSIAVGKRFLPLSYFLTRKYKVVLPHQRVNFRALNVKIICKWMKIPFMIERIARFYLSLFFLCDYWCQLFKCVFGKVGEWFYVFCAHANYGRASRSCSPGAVSQGLLG